MDADCNYHALENLFSDKEKWAQVQDPSSEGHAIYQGMIAGLERFADDVRAFRGQVKLMTETCFEPPKRKNSRAYAEAYSYFYADCSIRRQIF